MVAPSIVSPSAPVGEEDGLLGHRTGASEARSHRSHQCLFSYTYSALTQNGRPSSRPKQGTSHRERSAFRARSRRQLQFRTENHPGAGRRQAKTPAGALRIPSLISTRRFSCRVTTGQKRTSRLVHRLHTDEKGSCRSGPNRPRINSKSPPKSQSRSSLVPDRAVHQLYIHIHRRIPAFRRCTTIECLCESNQTGS
jgi:hypothetical protein